MEEASRNGWAVIVLDVEGEYVDMDLPADDADSERGLARYQVARRVDRDPGGRGDVAEEEWIGVQVVDPTETKGGGALHGLRFRRRRTLPRERRQASPRPDGGVTLVPELGP